MNSSLSFKVADGVATLVIHRAAVSNAIDITIIRAMHLALDQIQKGDSGARTVVITGSNDVFCSGLDLHSVDLKTQEARHRAHFEMRRFMDPLILRLSGFRFPIVAAVNGAAVGAGMSLALASDIIIANLTPFRGASADAGTLVEVGWFLGRGRPVFGYSNTATPFAARSAAQAAAVPDPLPGLGIEGFALPDNLMVPGAVEYGGGLPITLPPDGISRPFDALDIFEQCVAAAARHLRG